MKPDHSFKPTPSARPNLGVRPMKKIVFLLILLVASSVMAEDKEPLGPDQWPRTVEATVSDLISSLPDADKATVRETKKEDLIRFHHGWGTWIRNHYGLWRGNDELIESACGRRCHPDEASMVIIEAVWTALQEQAN